ncbi:multicopper oxidase domain-containing protein [uncultured Clostridium sp.]|uniref:multicopper oxidase domain-containing protein n=1 Tax=uncultured Clostridium sp. TaxID=59620 RepID=UPI003458455A
MRINAFTPIQSRFLAKHPGIWPMHCHIPHHTTNICALIHRKRLPHSLCNSTIH